MIGIYLACPASSLRSCTRRPCTFFLISIARADHSHDASERDEDFEMRARVPTLLMQPHECHVAAVSIVISRAKSDKRSSPPKQAAFNCTHCTDQLVRALFNWLMVTASAATKRLACNSHQSVTELLAFVR